jgi:hypothetical protein
MLEDLGRDEKSSGDHDQQDNNDSYEILIQKFFDRFAEIIQ